MWCGGGTKIEKVMIQDFSRLINKCCGYFIFFGRGVRLGKYFMGAMKIIVPC